MVQIKNKSGIYLHKKPAYSKIVITNKKKGGNVESENAKPYAFHPTRTYTGASNSSPMLLNYI